MCFPSYLSGNNPYGWLHTTGSFCLMRAAPDALGGFDDLLGDDDFDAPDESTSVVDREAPLSVPTSPAAAAAAAAPAALPPGALLVLVLCPWPPFCLEINIS